MFREERQRKRAVATGEEQQWQGRATKCDGIVTIRDAGELN